MPGQGTGNRGQANLFIPSLIEEGMNNAQIVDFLRLNDMGYRSQNMYSDINRVRAEINAHAMIADRFFDEPIPERYMKTWEGDTSKRYRVVIQYNYGVTDGGGLGSKGTTLYYNRRPTQEQIMQDWEIRRQTLESGAGSPQDVEQIIGIKSIDYFKNVKKR